MWCWSIVTIICSAHYWIPGCLLLLIFQAVEKVVKSSRNWNMWKDMLCDSSMLISNARLIWRPAVTPTSERIQNLVYLVGIDKSICFNLCVLFSKFFVTAEFSRIGQYRELEYIAWGMRHEALVRQPFMPTPFKLPQTIMTLPILQNLHLGGLVDCPARRLMRALCQAVQWLLIS